MTRSRLIVAVVGLLLCAACAPLGAWLPPTATPTPTATLTPSPTQTLTSTVPPTSTPWATMWATRPPLPTSTPIVPDTGWQTLEPGLERRVINLLDEAGRWVESLYLLRLEPGFFRFDVAYDSRPRSLDDWYAETGALIIVNGGYFRLEGEDHIPTGLTIVNGEAIGSSYGDFAGMFVVTDAGPGLRWLAQRPYQPGEPIRAAVQCFPILIKPGGEVGFPASAEDYHLARRTVIAQDRDGRILLLVADFGHFSLHQLSLYLSESDLALELAVNLDGGPSSGVLLSEPYERVPSFSRLPVVITVHRR